MCKACGSPYDHSRQEASESHFAARARSAALSDATAQRRDFLFRPPSSLASAFHSLLADPRDAPLLYLLLNVVTTTVPAALIIHRLAPAMSAPYAHLLGAVYLAGNYGAFLQRFLLALHYSAHRPLFRPGVSGLNTVMPYLVAPLFGVPPGMYSLHHCVLHHVVRCSVHRPA